MTDSVSLPKPIHRSSNIELLRIISMLLIVAHHYVVCSGLMGTISQSPTTMQSLFLLIFGAWGKMGINCFVLITGYFMCRSNITALKFCKLLFEIFFYDLLFYLIFYAAGYHDFSIKYFLSLLWPIKTISNSFLPSFMLFYLFIPFINRLISNLSEKEHLRLIILTVFFYSFLPVIPGITLVFNYVSWFTILYFIASYIRFYPKSFYSKPKICTIIMLVTMFLGSASIVIYAYLTPITGKFYPFNFLIDSNRPLALLCALALFLFFKSLNMDYHPFINKVASTMLGVLLIHSNGNAMRTWLWKDTLHNVDMYSSPWLYCHAIASIIGVFVSCVMIDLLRIRFIEKPWLKLTGMVITKMEPWVKSTWVKLTSHL